MRNLTKILSAVLLVAGLLCAVTAFSPTVEPAPVHVFAPSPPPIQEQIINLPETGSAWHLTLFLSPNWRDIPEQRMIVEWFTFDERLQTLKTQVHNHLYTTNLAIYRARYQQSVPIVPSILLQDATGRVYYKVGSTAPIPQTPDQLADDISRAIESVTRPCPRPNPKPDPDEEPDPGPEPNVIPDMPRPIVPAGPEAPVVPKPAESPTAAVYGLVLLAFCVGIAIGAISVFKRALNQV